MPCDISMGQAGLACKNAISGIKKVYFANYDDYDFTVSSTVSGNTLSDLGTLDVVYGYETKNSGNSFDEAGTPNRDNGTTFFAPTLTVVLTKMNAQLDFQIRQMLWGRPIIFVETMGNEMFVLGVENGMEMTSQGTLGGLMDGVNSTTLTAVGMETNTKYWLTPAMRDALKEIVSTSNIAI